MCFAAKDSPIRVVAMADSDVGTVVGLPEDPMQREVMVAQAQAAGAAPNTEHPTMNGVGATRARSGVTNLLAEESSTSATEETVSFAGREGAPPTEGGPGGTVVRETASQHSQAGPERLGTNYDCGGAGPAEPTARREQVTATGYSTPRSTRLLQNGGQHWVAGLEMPSWVTRLGSYLSRGPQNEFFPSPLGGSQGSQRSLPGGPTFTLRPPSRPPTSPETPSSSSLPQEAIQAEVQRQLGQVLQKLQEAERRNERLEQELAAERGQAMAMKGLYGISPTEPSRPSDQVPSGLQGVLGPTEPSRHPDQVPSGLQGVLGPTEPSRHPDQVPSGLQGVLGPTEPSRHPDQVFSGLQGVLGPTEPSRQPDQVPPGLTGDLRGEWNPRSTDAQGSQAPSFLRPLLSGGSRPPTPPIPREPSSPTGGPVVEILAKGIKQLQELQAQNLSKTTSTTASQEVVKPGTVALSPLPEYRASDGAGSSALQLQDWMEVATTVLADVSENSGTWWSAVMELVNGTYARWLAATPLERLQITPEGAEALCTGRWTRVNARTASMLLSAMGEELRGEMISQRITQSSPRMVFRLFVLFQPGGSAERQEVLRKLQNPGEFVAGDGLEEALKTLRCWPRWLARCKSVNMSPPDASVMVRGLMNLTTKHISASPDATFRTAMLRTSLRLDAQPSLSQVQDYQKHLQAELETILASSGTTSTGLAATSSPKVRALDTSGSPKNKEKEKGGTEMCRYFIKPSGCRRGSRCTFSHNMATLDKETRARKCLQCGSESHRQKDCQVNVKPGAKTKPSPTSSTSTTTRSAGSAGQGQATPTVAAVAPTEPNEPVQGTPWTFETLMQAAQQVIQSQGQPATGGPDGGKSPEKTPSSMKVLVVKDIRVCSLQSSSSALLDSGATHSLRSAGSWEGGGGAAGRKS